MQFTTLRWGNWRSWSFLFTVLNGPYSFRWNSNGWLVCVSFLENKFYSNGSSGKLWASCTYLFQQHFRKKNAIIYFAESITFIDRIYRLFYYYFLSGKTNIHYKIVSNVPTGMFLWISGWKLLIFPSNLDWVYIIEESLYHMLACAPKYTPLYELHFVRLYVWKFIRLYCLVFSTLHFKDSGKVLYKMQCSK